MTPLSPLDTLYDVDHGPDLPLPPDLAALYGRLSVPLQPGRPHVIGNFVTTLDGVVALGVPGHEGGGDISGFDAHDRMVMGLLRAVADVVIVGAGTLRADPDHLWTAARIYPPLADAYQALRTALGKPDPPLTVVVTATGHIDLGRPVFRSGETPVLVVTTRAGARRLRHLDVPPAVWIEALPDADPVTARRLVAVVQRVQRSDLILVEGGPRLMDTFVAERRLDEQFLTLAPQIAGRDATHERPGLVAGHIFAPADPRWGRLVSVKRARSHLFLRYALAQAGAADTPWEDGSV